MQWATETWSSPQLKQEPVASRTDSIGRNSHSIVSPQAVSHAFRSAQGTSTAQNTTPHMPVACRYPYYNNNLDPATASLAASYHDDFSAWNSFDLATHQQRAFHFATPAAAAAAVNAPPVMSFTHLPGHRTAGYTFGVAGGVVKPAHRGYPQPRQTTESEEQSVGRIPSYKFWN
ncbi:hypothetical protein HOLleu_41901 [Holothuria leucospilota]|uniref:Uncharacterized protein n=1 Tax=Holothuria leucospilota TaxID=206669 RepID=A0A9Q1BCD9_HOLLE|nr:hypothetical protein HOLleu_41901 [Holothuria leucospilota]